jgi:hypothetical protein
MNTGILPREPARRTPAKLHAYFVVFSLGFAAIVPAGFSRTFLIPVVRGTFSRPPVVYIHGELADLAMFGLLAGGAMLLRNKPDFHKRWVLLGSLGLIGAAVGRIPELRGSFLCIFLGLIASMAAYDLFSRRSIHVATAMGAAVLFTLGLSEEFIGNTQAWLRAAHYMLGV